MTLLQQLEAAGEGSRELDALVWADLRPFADADEHRKSYDTNPDGYWFWIVPQPVTTSLDAALALAERVLPGCCVLVGDYKGLANHTRWNGEGEVRATKGWCSLSTDDAASSNYRVHAHTPALALCAAILRARPAGEGGA